MQEIRIAIQVHEMEKFDATELKFLTDSLLDPIENALGSIRDVKESDREKIMIEAKNVSDLFDEPCE